MLPSSTCDDLLPTAAASYSQVFVSCHLSLCAVMLLCISSSLPIRHISSTPPPQTGTHCLAPLRDPCQSRACKWGLDEGLGGQPAPLCPPLCSLAHWRMKLACSGASVEQGHSRQPGSGARPALHLLHQHPQPTHQTLHTLPTPPSHTSPGSVPVIPCTL